MKQYFVYITTNKTKTVLYTGVTSNLIKRIYEHKHKLVEGFTQRYNVDRLIYFEVYEDAQTAIQREKTIKNMVRRKKEVLIDSRNPAWEDLYQDII